MIFGYAPTVADSGGISALGDSHALRIVARRQADAQTPGVSIGAGVEAGVNPVAVSDVEAGAVVVGARARPTRESVRSPD